MRICLTVQRYGEDVAGGAETWSRMIGEHLVERGHEVSVLTSCAQSYVTWANEYPPGASDLNGVTVHRLPVDQPRHPLLFGPLNARVVWGNRPVPMSLQRHWLRVQGPWLPEQPSWYRSHTGDFDVHVFFTYLYAPTAEGIRVAAASAPTVLHPTAHDEPPFWLPIFDHEFHDATALAFATPEEEELVRRRSGTASPGEVIGIGMDLDEAGDAGRFRRRFGLGDDPFLLFLGRVDPNKGSDEIVDYFLAYQQRNPSDLRLVIVGDAVTRPPESDKIVVTGYVDDQTRIDALAACTVFVQPSYFESFSMALAEAWVHRKPALVQGRCDVLLGQATRSQGGLPYRGFAEFEAALDVLMAQPGLAAALGRAGRNYVDRHYSWPVVMDRYEALLDLAVARRSPSPV
ncbi:MAG TPA: glycosyltransferase family 4 protein [Acidimicrobiales bacterium]|jgi:glycosyltransferase involved in cell wall biosynthesis